MNDTSKPLDALPLFADDTALGAALLGPRRSREWRQIATLLEARGLPKIDDLMGGRYVSAVRAFFDRECGLKERAVLAPDGVEDLGAWKRKRTQQV
jgi:hypothetical protein